MGGGGRALYAVGGASHNFAFIYSPFSLPNRDGKGGGGRSAITTETKGSHGLIPERLERGGLC
jgi:hypothetical protein